MTFLSRAVFTPLYAIWFLLVTVVFLAWCPLHLALYRLRRGGPLNEGLLDFIYFYGLALLRLFWPLLRLKAEGLENRPGRGPAVFVLNHRSATDAYFAPLFAFRQTVFFVRHWPFSIPFYGWFMRGAGYIDSEMIPFSSMLNEYGAAMAARGTSFIFFPEGHRSRDGRMHRFHTGAFEFAMAHGLPVVPVCLTGTEAFFPVARPGLNPARVKASILPAVDPAAFKGQDASYLLKKHVEALMRKHLGE
jgi:1-acyl-sn-glycerol-3-phosphate acyltransferase